MGAGISGLSCAFELAKSNRVDVTVVEEKPVPGGKIVANNRGIDVGPDSFISRGRSAIDLIGELGLADQMVTPDTKGAYISTRHGLRPLPEGLFMGVPTDLVSVARSRVVPRLGLARAGLDLILPRTSFSSEVSVERFISARLGRSVLDNLIDPLLGGIHAGNSRDLSMNWVAPSLVELYRRSLIVDLARTRAKTGTGPPRATGSNEQEGPKGETEVPASPFLSVRGGMHRLVEALVETLSGRYGVRFLYNSKVVQAEKSWVMTQDNSRLECDHLVLACPAFEVPDIVADRSLEVLRTLSYASVGVITMYFPKVSLPEGTGLLSPRARGTLMTGATWLSNKWAFYDTGECVIRVSVGKIDDTRWVDLDDGDLVGRVYCELDSAMRSLGVNLPGPPSEYHVQRWMRAIAQYNVGHGELVGSVTLPPNVYLAGSYMCGVGIPACISSGQAAAKRLLG